MKYSKPAQCNFSEEGFAGTLKVPGKEPGHVYASNPRDAEAVGSSSRQKSLWAEEEERISQGDRGVERRMH